MSGMGWGGAQSHMRHADNKVKNVRVTLCLCSDDTTPPHSIHTRNRQIHYSPAVYHKRKVPVLLLRSPDGVTGSKGVGFSGSTSIRRSSAKSDEEFPSRIWSFWAQFPRLRQTSEPPPSSMLRAATTTVQIICRLAKTLIAFRLFLVILSCFSQKSQTTEDRIIIPIMLLPVVCHKRMRSQSGRIFLPQK